MYFVELEGDRIRNVFDSENNNVPENAQPITAEQFNAMKAHPVGFGVFKFESGDIVEDEERALDAIDKIRAAQNPQSLLDKVVQLTGEVERLKGEQAALRARVPPQAT